MMRGAHALALVAALAAPALPEGCGKLLGKKAAPPPSATAEPPPPPTPVGPTVKAPPVWSPPDTAPPASAPPPQPANTDLAKAQEASEKHEYKKVRAILEKKMKAGTLSSEEYDLMMEACSSLKDKKCLDALKAQSETSDLGSQ